MGAHSTLRISREIALQKIHEMIGIASNSQLEEILFELWGDDKLYNFNIVNYQAEDDHLVIKKEDNEYL